MMYEQPVSIEQTARLEDYLDAIRARPLVVLATPLLVMLVVWVALSQRPVSYQASAAVALGPTPVGSTNSSLAAPKEEREAALLASNAVAGEVIENLGLSVSSSQLLRELDVVFVPGSAVLDLTLRQPSAEVAAAAVNEFALVYVAKREAEADAYYEGQIAEIDRQVSAVAAELQQVETELDSIEAERTQTLQLVADRSDPRIVELDIQISRLQTDQSELQRSSRSLLANRQATEIQLATRQSTAEVLRTSEPPTRPAGLSKRMTTIAAGICGLILGVVAAFLLDRLDTRAREASEIAAALGRPILGEVPVFSRRPLQGTAALVMVANDRSSRVYFAREAYRRLRSAVLFQAIDREGSGGYVVSFTSAHPSEGKSVTASNLAAALAQAGRVTVLVSADLRRPQVESIVGIGAFQTGLSTYLANQEPDLDLLDTQVPNLYVIPSGPVPANPSELLGQPAFDRMLDELRKTAEIVLIDTPPVLSAADALVIGRKVDGTVLVVDSNETETSDLLQVRSEFERAGINVLGAVANRVREPRATLFGAFRQKNRYAYSSVVNASETAAA